MKKLTFTGYNAFERPIDHSAVSPVPSVTTMPAFLEPESDTIVVVRSGGPTIEAPQVTRPVAYHTAIATKKAVYGARKNYVERQLDMADFQKPVVITYKTSEPVNFSAEYPVIPAKVREPELRGNTLAVKPKPEKRSLASKALPVLKKPYDWLKAMAGIFR
jgi:hypothetical protein